MGKGSSAPETPDYAAAAEKTAAGNLEAAKYATQANRANQFTPLGSLTWTNDRVFNQAAYDAAMNAYNQGLMGSSGQQQSGTKYYSPITGNKYSSEPYNDGEWARGYSNRSGSGGSGSGSGAVMPNAKDFYTGGDNWSQTVTLSPEMQKIFDQQMVLSQGLFGAQNSALDRVNGSMNAPMDVSGFQQLGDVYDPTLATNTATEAIMSRLNPELDRQYEALRNQLANQGIAMGSAAYENAMNTFGQQRNDAATQAGLQGISLGMQQQGQTFNQSSNKRNQQLQEAAYLRNMPLNELNSLRAGSQVQMPTFNSYAQQATVGGADYSGAAQNQYQANVAKANASNAEQSGLMSGLFGIAGGTLGGVYGGLPGAQAGFGLGSSVGGMFSDRRLKTDIKRIGESENGLGIYSYKYIWGGPSQIGYMADEVEKVSPQAVSDFGGLKMVDYSKV